MKKLLAIFLIAGSVFASAVAVPTAFNETKPENWGNIKYYSVPVYKIIDSKDAYVVLYAKSKIGIGQTVIPKKWNFGTPEAPRKLKVRILPGGKLKPHMTVVKEDGKFNHVILNVPRSKADPTWSATMYTHSVEGADKDVLEELEL